MLGVVLTRRRHSVARAPSYPREMGHPEVGEARVVARRLRFYGLMTFTAGWVIAGASVLLWVTGQAGFADAVDVILLVGLGGVMSGVAMIASGVNLRLNATRLELQLRSQTG